MEFSKRSRTTNREQFSLTTFWTSLTTDLNALGPPSKSTAEWKKVWSDFKSAIKKKVTHNKKQLQATGGGPNTEVHLSSLEDEVAQLVSINDAVGGVNGRGYGYQQGQSRSVPACEPSASSEVRAEVAENEESAGTGETNVSTATTSQQQVRQPQRVTQSRLLRTQIENQKKFHDNVSSSLRGQKRKLDDLTKDISKIEKTMRSLDNNVRVMCSSLQDLVAETKRHNLASEQLLRDKTRIKQQLLQLELEKISTTLSK